MLPILQGLSDSNACLGLAAVLDFSLVFKDYLKTDPKFKLAFKMLIKAE